MNNKTTTMCVAWLVLCMSLLAALPSRAQVYMGERGYDGEHRQEIYAYAMGGNNLISGGFGGIAARYKRHLNNRWNVGGALQTQFGKQLYSIYAQGGYRLPWKHGVFCFDGQLLYSRYNRYDCNEYNMNVSATWEHNYFYLRVGESWIQYRLLDNHYTEPLTFTFGAGVNVRPRSSVWNMGLFFRNYDEFYYENWNINWGIHWNASINSHMKLFGEFDIRPAGSMSQLASRYETSVKLGMKYLLK